MPWEASKRSMMATARSSFSSGTRAATSVLPLPAASAKLASVLLAEAMLGDLAHELVGITLQDLDVPVLEALAEKGIDHLAGDLLVVKSADDGRCHLVSLHVWLVV